MDNVFLPFIKVYHLSFQCLSICNGDIKCLQKALYYNVLFGEGGGGARIFVQPMILNSQKCVDGLLILLLHWTVLNISKFQTMTEIKWTSLKCTDDTLSQMSLSIQTSAVNISTFNASDYIFQFNALQLFNAGARVGHPTHSCYFGFSFSW